MRCPTKRPTGQRGHKGKLMRSNDARWNNRRPAWGCDRTTTAVFVASHNNHRRQQPHHSLNTRLEVGTTPSTQTRTPDIGRKKKGKKFRRRHALTAWTRSNSHNNTCSVWFSPDREPLLFFFFVFRFFFLYCFVCTSTTRNKEQSEQHHGHPKRSRSPPRR